jgi:hypothetical protein
MKASIETMLRISGLIAECSHEVVRRSGFTEAEDANTEINEDMDELRNYLDIAAHCASSVIERLRGLDYAERIAKMDESPEIPSTALLNALTDIVNVAQACPDRCMADVCNDTFVVRGIPLVAKLTHSEDLGVEFQERSGAE